jgi:hypothetical protein
MSASTDGKCLPECGCLPSSRAEAGAIPMEITTVGIDSANSISPPAGPTLGAGTIGRRRRLGRRLIASRRAHPALDPSSSADLVDHIDIGGDRRVRLHRRIGRIGKRIGGSLNLRTEADPATDTLRQQGLCDVGIVAEDLRRSDPVAEREQSACVQTQIAATVSRGSTDAHAKSGGCTPMLVLPRQLSMPAAASPGAITAGAWRRA